MKSNNNLLLIIAFLAVIILTGVGVRSYYRSAERELIKTYNTEIKVNNDSIAALNKRNVYLLKQISRDSTMIVEKNKEIARLKGQYIIIQQDLLAAKDQIKSFTAGQSAKFFDEYLGVTDSKMLVQPPDTSLIITAATVKKADDVFVEHKFDKLSIVNLNRTITGMQGLIVDYIGTIKDYKTLVNNKNTEIDLLKQNAIANTKKTEQQLAKLKVQRNRARYTAAGFVAVILAKPIITFLKTK